jgi:hypothetical protein
VTANLADVLFTLSAVLFLDASRRFYCSARHAARRRP